MNKKMAILCRIFAPKKQRYFCNISPFFHLIHTSTQPEQNPIDDTRITSVLDSLHEGRNWKTLTQKFTSVKFTQSNVQTILLQFKEPINSRKALNFFHWSAKEMQFQHGISTYCILIHILVKARLTKDAKALLESVLTNREFCDGNGQEFVVLQSLIESYEVVDSVPFVFDLFVQTCAKLRMFDGILDACKLLFDHEFSLSLSSFNVLLHVMQKSDMTRLVWDVYEHMLFTKIYPNEATAGIMVSALCKEGKLEGFVHIIDRMHGKRCSIPRLIVNTCLVYEMIEDGRIEDGLVLLKQMLQKNMILDTVSYSLVIFAKVKMGNFDAAREIYEEMLKRGFEQNAFVCSLFIGEYSEEGRMDEAIGLFEEMETLVLKPLDETFDKLIEGCSVNGRLEDGLKFCKKMTGMGLLPSRSTVNKMFGKLCENGNSKKADEMLTILLDQGFIPDESTYSHLIDGYCKEGNVEGAVKLLFEMEYRLILPNVLVFSSLIVTLCKFGRLTEAEKYLKRMKAQSFLPSPSVYYSLIIAYLQKGDKIRASQLQCEMSETVLKTDDR